MTRFATTKSLQDVQTCQLVEANDILMTYTLNMLMK